MTDARTWTRRAWASLLQGAAVLVSILLAFAIDAGWEDRAERRTERALLESLLAEVRANQGDLSGRVSYASAVEASAVALLHLAEAGEVGADSVDTLVGGITWWNTGPWTTATLDALVSSGDLSLVEDRALRSRISSLARGLEDISRFEMDEANSTQDQLLPYLAAAGDLVAVARAQKTYPGTSESYAGSENLPPGGSFDHSEMVRSREFRNVVVMRYWAVSDLRRSYAELQVLLDAAAASISAALGELATAV